MHNIARGTEKRHEAYSRLIEVVRYTLIMNSMIIYYQEILTYNEQFKVRGMSNRVDLPHVITQDR